MTCGLLLAATPLRLRSIIKEPAIARSFPASRRGPPQQISTAVGCDAGPSTGAGTPISPFIQAPLLVGSYRRADGVLWAHVDVHAEADGLAVPSRHQHFQQARAAKRGCRSRVKSAHPAASFADECASISDRLHQLASCAWMMWGWKGVLWRAGMACASVRCWGHVAGSEQDRVSPARLQQNIRHRDPCRARAGGACMHGRERPPVRPRRPAACNSEAGARAQARAASRGPYAEARPQGRKGLQAAAPETSPPRPGCCG